jgi:hypothetical protein
MWVQTMEKSPLSIHSAGQYSVQTKAITLNRCLCPNCIRRFDTSRVAFRKGTQNGLISIGRLTFNDSAPMYDQGNRKQLCFRLIEQNIRSYMTLFSYGLTVCLTLLVPVDWKTVLLNVRGSISHTTSTEHTTQIRIPQKRFCSITVF